MRTVGIKVLKNRLSEYVRLAARGETVLVTDRERVVAELTPPAPGRSPLLQDALLAEAVRAGFITAPAANPGGAPGRAPRLALEKILHDLAGDRADR